MTQHKRIEGLARLLRLSEMVRDRDMALLRSATLAREKSEAHLADLAKPMRTEGLAPMASALAEIRWQKWADHRKAEINLQLARQIVEWDEARDKACQTFARAEVLRRALLQKSASD